MSRIEVRRSVLTAMLAAVLTLNTLNVVARADERYQFDLTVNLTASTDESFVREVGRAAVQVDVYRVASAIQNTARGAYEYSWDSEGFSKLETRFDALVEGRETTASDWQALYDAAARMVAEGEVSAEPVSETMVDGKAEVTLNARGLYLVIAHGVGEAAGSTAARLENSVIEFSPTMISAPVRQVDGASNETSDACADRSDDVWHDEAAIYLKPAARLATEPAVHAEKGIVQTGDETQTRLFPLYVIMTGSGIALIGLAGYGVIERHQERKTTR